MNGHVAAHLSGAEIGLVIVILFVLLIVLVIVRLVKDFWKTFVKDMILIMVWRHFSGQHYHGDRVTDATFFSAGTTSSRKYNKDGWMDRWEHRPIWYRAAWRWGCTLAFVATVYGLFADFGVTVNALRALGIYILMLWVLKAENAIRLRVHNRHLRNPMAKSLAKDVFRTMSYQAVRKLIHIDPENVTDEGDVGWIEIPPEYTPGDEMKSTIARIIDAHIPFDTEAEFKLLQAPKLAVVKPAQKPPDIVLWDETVDAMRAAAYGDIIIGKDRFKNIFKANFLDQEDPHWAFCVQTKRGKSNFLGLVAVQVLHQDPQAQVIFVDPKRSSVIDYLGSPDWAEGVDNGLKPLIRGVTMANNPMRPQDMLAAVERAYQIFHKRSEEAALDRNKKFPVVLLMLDELNFLRQTMTDWWNKILAANAKRPRDQRDDLPKECPVWPLIRTLLQAGRFVGVHVVATAQDFRDDAIGGKGAKHYFGYRGMGGTKDQQWRHFIGDSRPPVMQKGRGRWIFVQGEDQDWVQITFIDDPGKAYNWASRRRELFTDELDEAAVPVAELEAALPDAMYPLYSGSLGTKESSPAPAEPARKKVSTLKGAADYLGIDFYKFEKRRNRHPIEGEFTSGRRTCWYADDLERWHAERERKGNDSDD